MNQINSVDYFISNMVNNGWTITMQSDDGIQFVKKKEWSTIGLVLGFILLLLFGLGIILLVLTCVDYLLKSDKTVYVTKEQIKSGQAKAIIDKEMAPSYTFYVISGLLVFLIATFLLCANFM